MISGDNFQRNFTLPVPDPPKSDWTAKDETQSALAQKAIGFNCLNYNAAPEGSLYRHFLPDKNYLDENCLDGVRFELMFPSCWNGKDVDSPNHKSHVAFPNLVMTGTCPEGFETQLPSLFYETIWNTQNFKGIDGQFVIANGDPTGYGYHGDFMMGWDPDFLQQAVNTCTNLSGNVQDCPIFDLQSDDDSAMCTFPMPEQIANEAVINAGNHLPGNVPIQSGPAYATNPPMAGAAATASASTILPNTTGAAVPTLSYSSIAASETAVSSGGGVEVDTSAIASAATESLASPLTSTGASAELFAESAAATTTAAPLTSAAGSLPTVATSVWTSAGVVHNEYIVLDAVTVTVDGPAPTGTVQKRHEHHLNHHRHGHHALH